MPQSAGMEVWLEGGMGAWLVEVWHSVAPGYWRAGEVVGWTGGVSGSARKRDRKGIEKRDRVKGVEGRKGKEELATGNMHTWLLVT